MAGSGSPLARVPGGRHPLEGRHGLPCSWRKLRGAWEFEWVGFQINLKSAAVGLSDNRTEWILKWLEEILSGGGIAVFKVAEGLGRLAYGVAAAEELGPFLAPPSTRGRPPSLAAPSSRSRCRSGSWRGV